MEVMKCSSCDKEFGNEASLEQHAAAKHKKEQVTGEVTKTSSKKLFLMGGIAVVVIGLMWIAFFGTGDDSSSSGPVIDFAPIKVLGNENATVTLTEYSDFQCPFCGRFFRETERLIIKEYVDTGKVKFVYKHYPVDRIHPQATLSAVASECAHEQGKFWEYHDILFSNQNSLNEKSYKTWAQDLNLDSEQFNECYADKRYRSVVKSDFQEGINAGVKGTPGFTVNDRLVSGAQPFSVFQRLIEEQLAT